VYTAVDVRRSPCLLPSNTAVGTAGSGVERTSVEWGRPPVGCRLSTLAGLGGPQRCAADRARYPRHRIRAHFDRCMGLAVQRPLVSRAWRHPKRSKPSCANLRE
jgi:hypothetical protein